MTFNWELRVPYQYGNRYVTLRELETIMLRSYNRETVRRFLAWLHYKNGNVGAGGLARTEQPTGPTFAASLYVSFHWAGQEYNDGTTGACAIDTVLRDGPDLGDAHDSIPWREVPIQGSAEAAKWGLHANVGSPTGSGLNESWHIQPVEIDGHASWVRAGRPAPVTGYPIPAEHDPYAQIVEPEQPEPPTPQEIPDMLFIAKPTFPGAKASDPWIVYYDNPGSGKRAERAINAHTNAAKILGVPIVPQDSEEQYLNALATYDIPRNP